MKKLNKIAITLGLLVLGASMNAQAASCSNTTYTTVNSVNIADYNTTDVTIDSTEAHSCSYHNGNDDKYKSVINTDFGLADTITWNDPIKSDDHADLLSYDIDTETFTLVDPGVFAPFVVVLKGGTDFVSYLFTQPEQATEGLFSIFLSQPELSHISVYAMATGPGPGIDIFGNPVPLPAALWLFAPALLGFMGFRRKSKA